MAKRDLMSGTPADRGKEPLSIDMATLVAYSQKIIATMPDPDCNGGRQYLLPGLAMACVWMCHAAGERGDLKAHHDTMKAFHKLLEQFHGDLIREDVKALREADKSKGKT